MREILRAPVKVKIPLFTWGFIKEAIKSINEQINVYII